MPANLERCVAKVRAQISRGDLPKDSNPWAICVSTLKKAGTIKKAKKGSKHRWVRGKGK